MNRIFITLICVSIMLNSLAQPSSFNISFLSRAPSEFKAIEINFFNQYQSKLDSFSKVNGSFIYSDSTLQINGSYKNGIKESNWTVRILNYDSYISGGFKNNLKDSIWTIYVEKTIFKFNYKNDLLDGVWTKYYENGKIETTGKYIKGNKIGIWTSYNYGNGKVKTKITYSNNERNRTEINYHEDGTLNCTYNIIDNKTEGLKNFYNDGKIYQSEEYKNDKLNGKLKRYINGKIYQSAEYKNGKLNGRSESYDNGKFLQTGYYINDMKNGKFEYYAFGKIFQIDYYIDDVLQKAEFLANGKIYQIDYYVNGEFIRSKKLY